VPVNAHRGDLAVFGLAEDGAPGIDPFARAAAPVGAAELGGEPRPGRVDLAGLERDIRLVQRDVLPVRPDGVDPGGALAERCAEERAVGGEYGGRGIHRPPPPPPPQPLQQPARRRPHGAPYTTIPNYGSGRMVHEG